MKTNAIEYLESHKSETTSKWREEAQWRRENAAWLRHSQQIAVAVLLEMKSQKLTQSQLAERMGCTQQYVSKILKGAENLSLDTLTRLENALQIELLCTPRKKASSVKFNKYTQASISSCNLSEPESDYGSTEKNHRE